MHVIEFCVHTPCWHLYNYKACINYFKTAQNSSTKVLLPYTYTTVYSKRPHTAAKTAYNLHRQIPGVPQTITSVANCQSCLFPAFSRNHVAIHPWMVWRAVGSLGNRILRSGLVVCNKLRGCATRGTGCNPKPQTDFVLCLSLLVTLDPSSPVSRCSGKKTLAPRA